GHAHRRRAADGHGARAVCQEDTHSQLADPAHLRAGVVVRKDATVLPTVPRVPVRAPLAHADAVTPAVAGDDQGRSRASGSGGRAGDGKPQGNTQLHPHGTSPSSLKVGQTRKTKAEHVKSRGSLDEGRPRLRRMRRLLVANRGEIALRVFRACRAEGAETVAVVAPDDTGALHACSADAVVEISSYLDSAEYVRAARESEADAVHPGYGFLSESPEL